MISLQLIPVTHDAAPPFAYEFSIDLDPVTPPRKRSKESKPLTVLTCKPPCAACEQARETSMLAPLPPRLQGDLDARPSAPRRPRPALRLSVCAFSVSRYGAARSGSTQSCAGVSASSWERAASYISEELMSNYVSLQYYFKVIQYIEIHNMKNFLGREGVTTRL